MTDASLDKHTLGWIGLGRMGFSMASRLLQRGCELAAYNRTRSKAEPLAPLGARIVAAPAELAERDIVFTMVSASADLLEVLSGPAGLLSRKGKAPRIIIDCSTVSQIGRAHV